MLKAPNLSTRRPGWNLQLPDRRSRMTAELQVLAVEPGFTHWELLILPIIYHQSVANPVPPSVKILTKTCDPPPPPPKKSCDYDNLQKIQNIYYKSGYNYAI